MERETKRFYKNPGRAGGGPSDFCKKRTGHMEREPGRGVGKGSGGGLILPRHSRMRVAEYPGPEGPSLYCNTVSGGFRAVWPRRLSLVERETECFYKNPGRAGGVPSDFCKNWPRYEEREPERGAGAGAEE